MWGLSKSLAVSLLPQSTASRLRVGVRRLRGLYIARVNSERDAKEVFSEIYHRNLWGGEINTFYSGSDVSDKPAISYVSTIVGFIEKNKIRSVIELHPVPKTPS